jgi:hypothetical protein
MPSKNPRLSVVLPPALAATLAALAEATGESASGLVRGLLEQSHPALQRMLQLVNAASAAKGQIGSGVADTLDRVQNDLERAMLEAEGRLGRAGLDLVTQAEAVRGRKRAGRGGRGADGAARAVSGSSTPVPVTRGSGRTITAKKPVKRGKRVGSV